MLLKASTARNRPFKMISSTDHLSLKTGLTPAVSISKNGTGAFGAAAGTVTEVANGWYNIALTTTDTNTQGALAYYITAAGADDTDFADEVVTDLPGDSVASVTAAVTVTGTPAVNVTQWNSGAVPATTVTGVPKVDVADWLGTAVNATTAGIPDVNTKNINNTAAATPGASGGLLISGTNSGTTTFGALTVTAALTVSGGVAVTQSALNGHGLSITGNGTGHGILSTSGSGATGDGIKAVAASTNGNGATLAKTGSGNDLNATTTPLTLAKTANITGFNDITAAAAATGVWQDTTAGDFTVASSIGKSLFTSGNAPGAASGLALVGSNMGTVSSVTGAVGSVTGAVGSVTAGVTLAAGAVDSVALATSGINAIWGAATRNLTGSQGIKKNTAKAGFLFAMTDSTNHNPVTGLTVTAQRSLDGAAFAGCTNSVVEVSGGWYKIDLAAGDLNGDTVALKFTGTSADQLNISLVTSS